MTTMTPTTTAAGSAHGRVVARLLETVRLLGGGGLTALATVPYIGVHRIIYLLM
jgi:hypothetical protein